MKCTRFLLLTAATISLSALVLQPAMAEAATVLPPAAEDATIDLLTKFGVPPQQQSALLAAAASGEPWDVYLADAIPVLTEKATIDGIEYGISRFADGSFSAFGIEVPVQSNTGEAGQRFGNDPAITQCHYATGSGHQSVTGCQIDGVWGTIIIGAIDVGYTLVDGGLDRMTDYGYGYQQCLYPTSCSSPALVLSQDVEGSEAAHGRWQADVTAAWGSWNVWVQLNVGDDSAWQSNS